MDALCKEVSKLFADGFWKMKGYQAHFYIKQDAQFRFFKAYVVFFLL